jgi:hypothetical protein
MANSKWSSIIAPQDGFKECMDNKPFAQGLASLEVGHGKAYIIGGT